MRPVGIDGESAGGAWPISESGVQQHFVASTQAPQVSAEVACVMHRHWTAAEKNTSARHVRVINLNASVSLLLMGS